MATFRYWRLSGLTVPGSYFEISEFQFMLAADSPATGATLTSAFSVAGGTLAEFNDGNAGTRCYWSQGTAQDPSFAVVWDFGAPLNIVGCRFFGFDTSDRFPSAFSIHASADNSSWELQGIHTATYPGNATATSMFSLGPVEMPPYLLLPGAISAVVARPIAHTPLGGNVLPGMQRADLPLAPGPGRIAGTLKVLTLPAAREVRLHDRRTGQLLRTTTSAPDGTYTFTRLQLARPYMVVGLDDAGQPSMYNAAVADMVEAGP